VKRFNGRPLIGGRVQGAPLCSSRAFTFAHGVDPETGNVTDVRSDMLGKNVKGTVLYYPFGKGSTTASAWFLEAVRLDNAPVAILTSSVDLAAVIGSVLADEIYGRKIPVIAGLPLGADKVLSSSSLAHVDGTNGEVNLD
jgi:predicted aconitase with swiveling domain